jgi:hypothetical protein
MRNVARLRDNKGMNTAGGKNVLIADIIPWRMTALKFLAAAVQIELVTCLV